MKNIIETFKDKSTKFYDYTSVNALAQDNDYDAKYSAQLKKELNKLVKIMVTNPVYMEEFSNLLNDKNLLVAYLTAEYLYPFYPTKSIEVMKNFLNQIENQTEKLALKIEIEGLTKQEDLFINSYKRIYGTENLESLNLEDEITESL